MRLAAFEDVTVILVTKGQDFSSLKAAYDAGIRNFGESYAQEFLKKYELANSAGLQDIRWHFIGAIQSNKIEIIIKANVIHSVSCIRHAELISQKTLSSKEIFLQVNLDGDKNRQGFLVPELPVVIPQLALLENIRIRGLMCIAPLHHGPDYWFSQMVGLKQDLLRSGMAEVKLSMGMSDDFLQALAHGANFIRVGRRVFGSRDEA